MNAENTQIFAPVDSTGAAQERVVPRPLLRRPTPADGAGMWALAAAVGLDLNSPYAYVLWGHDFAETSVVAVDPEPGPGPGGEIVGFVTGYRPPGRPDAVFVWQVGVADSHRGVGLAGRMLDELVERTGSRYLEATVTPSNEASARLFRGVGARRAAAVVERPAFAPALFPVAHEPEHWFRIGPFRALARDDPSAPTRR